MRSGSARRASTSANSRSKSGNRSNMPLIVRTVSPQLVLVSGPPAETTRWRYQNGLSRAPVAGDWEHLGGHRERLGQGAGHREGVALGHHDHEASVLGRHGRVAMAEIRRLGHDVQVDAD